MCWARRKLSYQGTEINLDGRWERISRRRRDRQAQRASKTGRSSAIARRLLEYGDRAKVPMNPKDTVGGLMMAIFDAEIESKLIQPTFLTHYPLDVSPLSRKNEKDPFIVDRFELFVYGREMANAFSELNDPVDQKERFEAQVRAKGAGDEEACDMDDDYVTALEYGDAADGGAGHRHRSHGDAVHRFAEHPRRDTVSPNECRRRGSDAPRPGQTAGDA